MALPQFAKKYIKKKKRSAAQLQACGGLKCYKNVS